MNNRNKRRNNRGNRKGGQSRDKNLSGGSGSKGISGIRSVSTNVTKEKSGPSVSKAPKEQKSSRDRKDRRDRRDRRDKRDSRDPRESRETKESREAREKANKKKNILKKFDIFNKSLKRPTSRRRGGDRMRALQRKKIILYKLESKKSTICPICSKTIKNMNTALVEEQSGQLAHFDCIFDNIKKNFNPVRGQRVVYLGSGGFALIQDVRENGRDKFKIVEKVQYNNKKSVK